MMNLLLKKNKPTESKKFYTLEELREEMEKPLKWYEKLHGYWLRLNDFRRWHRPRYYWQRAKRGYSDQDTWNFDHYLSRVIVGGLTQLKKEKHSYPSDLTPEKWDDILDEIILGFQIQALSSEWEIDPKELEKVNKSLALFSQYYFHFWD